MHSDLSTKKSITLCHIFPLFTTNVAKKNFF